MRLVVVVVMVTRPLLEVLAGWSENQLLGYLQMMWHTPQETESGPARSFFA